LSVKLAIDTIIDLLDRHPEEWTARGPYHLKNEKRGIFLNHDDCWSIHTKDCAIRITGWQFRRIKKAVRKAFAHNIIRAAFAE
jgi:hypothetical protein